MCREGYSPVLWGFKGERNHSRLVFYCLDSGSLPAATSHEVETQTQALQRLYHWARLWRKCMLHSSILKLYSSFRDLSLFCLFAWIPSVKSSVAGANLISIQQCNVPLREKRKEEDGSERLMESLILGLELNCMLVKSPTNLQGVLVSFVWFQFEELLWQCVKPARSFSLKLRFLPRHFVKATPQAALVVLLNVSKHLLSLLWCQGERWFLLSSKIAPVFWWLYI